MLVWVRISRRQLEYPHTPRLQYVASLRDTFPLQHSQPEKAMGRAKHATECVQPLALMQEATAR